MVNFMPDRANLIAIGTVAVSLVAGAFPATVESAKAEAPGSPSSPAARASKTFQQRFQESIERRDLVEEAVAWANVILGEDVPFKLSPSWRSESPSPKESIPVYLGVPRNPNHASSYAFVPDKERCIIVEGDQIPALETLMGGKSGTAIKQSPVQLMAFALMHESGHLALGHSGCFDEHGDRYQIERVLRRLQYRIQQDNLKNLVTESKKRENAADAFVVKEILAAKADAGSLTRSLRAMRLESTLTAVGFNLAAARMLGSFGSSALSTRKAREAFFDKGASHPNFELRVLRINAGLAPNSKFPQLLSDFEKRRKELEEERRVIL